MRSRYTNTLPKVEKQTTYADLVGTPHTRVVALKASFEAACNEVVEADRKAKEALKEAEEKAATILADAKKEHAETLKEAERLAKVMTDNSIDACNIRESALKNREDSLQKREQTFGTVNHSLDQFKSRVKLNVGGSKFETTRSTLEQRAPEGMLAAMFSGRHAVDSDEEGYVFIDRDGTHFGAILNFMRTGKAAWPENEAEKSAMKDELKYYMALDAFYQCRRKPFYDATGLVNFKESQAAVGVFNGEGDIDILLFKDKETAKACMDAFSGSGTRRLRFSKYDIYAGGYNRHNRTGVKVEETRGLGEEKDDAICEAFHETAQLYYGRE